MSEILVCTASWVDKSLLDSKLFYPRDARTAESRLRYYATNFPLVEVDSSYYALPGPWICNRCAAYRPVFMRVEGAPWRGLSAKVACPRIGG